MLAAHVGVIHDQDIAGFETVAPMTAHPVDNRRTEIGEKNRQSAKILRENVPVWIDDADTIIPHLVDHHVVRGLAQHGGHFVSDMGQAIAHDFDSYGIDRHIG